MHGAATGVTEFDAPDIQERYQSDAGDSDHQESCWCPRQPNEPEKDHPNRNHEGRQDPALERGITTEEKKDR